MANRYYNLVKDEARALLDEIINKTNIDNKLHEINKAMMFLYEPTVYSGNKGYEVQTDIEFTKTCHFLSRETPREIKGMSLLDVHILFESIKERNESNKNK